MEECLMICSGKHLCSDIHKNCFGFLKILSNFAEFKRIEASSFKEEVRGDFNPLFVSIALNRIALIKAVTDIRVWKLLTLNHQ
jgi:hypothetical protein